MDIGDREQLERFAREHHLHYDVQPETAIKSTESQVVGFSVRLLAMQEGGELGAPGRREDKELMVDLQRFTRTVISSTAAEAWTDIVPEHAALHESTTMRGADEVSVTLRVWRDENDRRSTTIADDPRLSAIREHLERLGVARRS